MFSFYIEKNIMDLKTKFQGGRTLAIPSGNGRKRVAFS